MRLSFVDATYGYNGKPVYSGLNFSIESGDGLCVLGKNGIGKTTFFKTILRDIPLISGKILVDDVSIETFSINKLATIVSYIPQAKSYTYGFSVIDIVLMGSVGKISFYSEPSKKEYAKAREILTRLGMDDYADKNYSCLSGGEQQMVLIGRAIMQGAEFILMDEPASNLDFYNQKKLMDIINELRAEGKSVIMISHMPDHGFSCCNKTLLLNRDNKYIFGATDEVLTMENLSGLYGVDMVISSGTSNSGKPYKISGIV